MIHFGPVVSNKIFYRVFPLVKLLLHDKVIVIIFYCSKISDKHSELLSPSIYPKLMWRFEGQNVIRKKDNNLYLLLLTVSILSVSQ